MDSVETRRGDVVGGMESRGVGCGVVADPTYSLIETKTTS